MNRQNAAAVMNATKLIKTGEVIEIGHVLNDKMPFFGTRRFAACIRSSMVRYLSRLGIRGPGWNVGRVLSG